jgi:Cu+-exporting ATPase
MNETTTYTFTVTGMHCASCGMLIDDALEELPGVHRSQTSVRAGRTLVDVDAADVDPLVIAAVITATGYPAQVQPS